MARPVFTSLRLLGRRGGKLTAADGHQQLQRDLVYAEQIELDHRDSVFAIGLVAIEFSSPETARLRYRIEGIDSDWVQLEQPRTELMLSYLPAGEYQLEAQAAGHVGEFAASRTLHLTVGAPPWRQPWAYAAYGLMALLAMLWMASRIGASARIKRAQIATLNRTVAERTAALEHANQLLLRSNQELERASRVDPLTQVSNRRDLQRWLHEQAAQLAANGGSDAHLLFCIVDIDDFKAINDRHGHQAGDEVLVALAGRLNQLCRNQDVVVRWGGEEFLILVRSTSFPDAPRIAERLRSAINDKPFVLESGLSLAVTCSVGFAPWPMLQSAPDASSCEQSINLADRALYAAKAAGKNAWVGLLPDTGLTRAALAALCSGATPEQLPPGSLRYLHSSEQAPELPHGVHEWQ
nr:GGDEF domain-containing protein [Pseudomarimonas arenosa]